MPLSMYTKLSLLIPPTFLMDTEVIFSLFLQKFTEKFIIFYKYIAPWLISIYVSKSVLKCVNLPIMILLYRGVKQVNTKNSHN